MSAGGGMRPAAVDVREEHRALLRTFREFGVVGPNGELREDPDTLRGAVAFLCSPEAEMVRGQTLIVDGGWSLLA